jgi:hypothetical protein
MRRRLRCGAIVALGLLGAAIPLAAGAGVEVLTEADNPTIAADMLVVRLTGPMVPPMARDLAAAWQASGDGRRRLLLDLDSPGGSLGEAEAIISALAAIRAEARIDTLVRHGALCASACIAVFVQGEDRAAGGASAWLFHGACRDPASNVPSLALTERYLAILRAAGVDDRFLCDLVAEGYVTTPGQLWLSGYELVHVHDAGIITRLLEPWRAEPPRDPPTGGPTGPH